MAQGLAGRRILVTGASSGIGEGIARACAAAGAAVAGLARRTDRLEALAAETGCIPVTVDLRDTAAAQAAVATAADALGGLDGVVNNAGLWRGGTVMDTTVESWRAMLEVNVLGLLAVTQAAVGHLRAAGGGDIVNISSLSGRRVPNAAAGVYSGTKFAVHAISEGLRRELLADRIRVTVVSPGMVAIEVGGGADLRDLGSDVSITPEHVARTIVHLLGQPPEITLREIALAPTAQES
jgi:NADP-dependent 3-hydroxy acid dehydrogenase YdfG